MVPIYRCSVPGSRGRVLTSLDGYKSAGSPGSPTFPHRVTTGCVLKVNQTCHQILSLRKCIFSYKVKPLTYLDVVA